MNRYLRLLIIWTIFAVTVGGLAGWQIGVQSGTKYGVRLEAMAARQAAAEASARSLVEALGSLCAGFDFYYKHDMARGAFRPVRCSPAEMNRTALVAYGFDTGRTQRAWMNEWGHLTEHRGTAVIEDGTWIVEVLDRDFLDDVRSAVLQP